MQVGGFLLVTLERPYDKWVPVTTAWRVHRLRMQERPLMWRVAANILNEHSRTGDKDGPQAWGLGEVLTVPPC